MPRPHVAAPPPDSRPSLACACAFRGCSDLGGAAVAEVLGARAPEPGLSGADRQQFKSKLRWQLWAAASSVTRPASTCGPISPIRCPCSPLRLAAGPQAHSIRHSQNDLLRRAPWPARRGPDDRPDAIQGRAYETRPARVSMSRHQPEPRRADPAYKPWARGPRVLAREVLGR